MKQPPLQLTELIIHLGSENRSFQRFPRSIGRLGHVKKLSCIGDRYHQNMPEEFCNLQSLEHLELKDLVCLSSLPNRFGDLTNLRHLNLAGCHQLKMLPDSFKQLKHLQYVNLKGCRNLTFNDADILENITKLEYLSFKYCEGLQVLPHHITKQAFLRKVDLEGTSFTEFPSNIGQLGRLEVLRIGSEKLESLPDSLGNLSSLTYLSFESCKKLRSLPESLGRLELLKSIYIYRTGMESLPKAFGHLISLQTLHIYSSPIRGLFFEFEESSSLPRLKSIHLEKVNMSTISIPEHFCPSLESLYVSNNDFLEEIRTLPRTVKTIMLRDCKRLKDIAGISSLRNLQSLSIMECPKLAELPSFAELASMKAIKITKCQISGKMEGLEMLTSLETLDVHTQWEVPGKTSLEHEQGLRRLGLSADKIGVEGCIKTLQKWPGEVSICARALGGVEPLVNTFTSSNLMVVEAVEADNNVRWSMGCCEGVCQIFHLFEEHRGDEEADEDGCRLKYRKTCWSVQSSPYNASQNCWRLRVPKSRFSDATTIMCFVINCLSQDERVTVVTLRPQADGTTFLESIGNVKLREGKWVWIGAFSRDKPERSPNVESDLEIRLSKENRVEMGVIAMGEERAVKDVFYRVLDALKM